jgi:polyhydroxyalkanoate synthesis regulator phasin
MRLLRREATAEASMASDDCEIQRIISALGLELIKELVGRPEATEEELRHILKEAVKSAKRRVEVKVDIQPHENEKERIESVLDWLKSKKGGNSSNVNG